jgi:hypothetical protein
MPVPHSEQLLLHRHAEAAAPVECEYAALPGASERLKLLESYPLLLGVAHLTRLFDKSARTIRGWLKDGKLPVVKIGNRRFVSRVVLERMLGGDPKTVANSAES